MKLIPRAFAVGFALAILAVAWPATAQERQPIAQVVGLTGEAAVIRPRERVPLTQGAPLYRGDRIVTRGGSRAQIRFEDGSTLTIGESSEIAVQRYAGTDSEGSTVLAMVFGIVRATVPDDRPGGFEIWTNAAVAAVRHTDWIVIKRHDRSAVFAADGEVAVTALEAEREFRLNAGDGIDIMRDGEIRGPQQWGQGRVDQVLDATRAP